LGSITITHRFHPFRGITFKVLKKRKVNGEMTLLLQCPLRGSFAVLEAWTDACPIPEDENSHQEISVDALLGLCELVKRIKPSPPPP
jgi:hypothetical protein